MKYIQFLLLMLFLSIGLASCNPDDVSDIQEEEEVYTVDPNSEEAEEEIDPND